MTRRFGAAPAVVTVLALLLYLGGGLVVVYALIGLGTPGRGVAGPLPLWGQALYGAFYVVLARALQLGVRWARMVALVLCGIGLALAVLYTFAGGPRAGVVQAVWPVVYLILLTRPATRAWFSADRVEAVPPDEPSPAG